MSGKGWNSTRFFPPLWTFTSHLFPSSGRKISISILSPFFLLHPVLTASEFKFHFNFHLNCKSKQVSKARVKWEVWNQREHRKWDIEIVTVDDRNFTRINFNLIVSVPLRDSLMMTAEKRQFEHFITAQKTKMRWYHSTLKLTCRSLDCVSSQSGIDFIRI